MTLSISFVLTLLVFSYLLGDNILYRLAIAAFVGLAAAYTAVITFQSVILPLLVTDGRSSFEISTNISLLVIGGTLTGLLLAKPFTQLRPITKLAMGFLIAVGSAVAVVGAITGTLLPLSQATGDLNASGNLLNGIIILVGVISTLLYFRYAAKQQPDGSVQRGRLMQVIASIGQGFIVITLGALYGAAILTSLTILSGQLAVLFS